MKKFLTAILAFFIGHSCTNFTGLIETDQYTITNAQQEKLKLVFSHNINGETHPCGCRHFPLGGLPQVAGKMNELKKKADFLYIDTGDTFFTSSNIPKNIQKSLAFGAENLAKGLDQLGLKYFVPGDQDFALGWDFLKKIANQVSFDFLISNLKDPQIIKHKEWASVKKGIHQIFFLGVIDPRIMPYKYQKYFSPVQQTLKKRLIELKERGYESENPFHRLIILSHSGYPYDKKLAEQNKQIDWIIGAHTQSFIREPLVYGEAKIGQVLSRNHYLGELEIDFTKDKGQDKYAIHEIREDLQELLVPNPFIDFIDRHKKKLSEIRNEEQSFIKPDYSQQKFSSAASCIDCHEKQGEFWQKTSHSLAYVTLINDKEANNLACVKCHSQGLNHERGFAKADDIVIFDELSKKLKGKSLKIHRQNYWKEIDKAFGKIKSVRKLSSKRRLKHSQVWASLDKEYQVLHNFANVQCLNCHDRHPEHPFEPEGHTKLNSTQYLAQVKDKCLACHDPDQSPGWYQKDEKGLAGAPNHQLVMKKIKEVSCPQYEE